LHFYVVKFLDLLVRPETIVFGRAYVLPQMFFLFFISPRYLQALSADRSESLHGGQY